MISDIVNDHSLVQRRRSVEAVGIVLLERPVAIFRTTHIHKISIGIVCKIEAQRKEAARAREALEIKSAVHDLQRRRHDLLEQTLPFRTARARQGALTVQDFNDTV